MNTLNPQSFWLTVKDVAKKKHVTQRKVMDAIEVDNLTAHVVQSMGKKFIFVEVDAKYKAFSNTSHLKLNLNALIDFTNERIKHPNGKRNTKVRPV